MNLKIKALLYSLGVLAASAVAGLSIVGIIEIIGIDMLPWIGVGFMTIMAFYVIYNITLSQLQYQDKLKEIVDQK
jgi:hypothetical protein